MDISADSNIGRILDEISWEGNARKYREGGAGLENVLTAEVFTALDWLPRTHFLAQVFDAAEGAKSARKSILNGVERSSVEVLVGNTHAQQPSGEPTSRAVQPDVVIQSPAMYCLVEAKRIRQPAQFQQPQLARSLATCLHQASSRTPMVCSSWESRLRCGSDQRGANLYTTLFFMGGVLSKLAPSLSILHARRMT